MPSPIRTTLVTLLLLGGAVIGGAWVGSKIAGVPFSTDLLKPYGGQDMSAPTMATSANTEPYTPRSEAGAILIANHAERVSDWGVTHRAMSLLHNKIALPEEQVARLFLAAIAEDDWNTARTLAATRHEVIAKSAPLVPMLAAIMNFSNDDIPSSTKILATVGYNPISQPVLPFVKGWITGETPKIGLIEAAQDISFTSINLVRFLEATQQYERADALMKKLQEADLSLRLRVWSEAYFERRKMQTELLFARAKIAELTGSMPSGFWEQEKQRVLINAAAHLKDRKTALALTLIDATDFLVQSNASAIALLYVKMAGKLAPDLDGVAMTTGSIYEAQENWARAREAYGLIAKKAPSFMIARLRIAHIFANEGQNDKALDEFNDLTRIYPKDPEVWYEKAEYLRGTVQDYKGAIAAYDKTIALMNGSVPPTYWALYLARGFCYELIGRPDEAIKDYELAVALEPNHPETLNTLAYAWAEKGINMDRAEKMALEALSLDPDAPHILDTLGWVYFKKGEVEKALPLLERSAAMMAYDATVNSHLGDVYNAIGRTREAEYMWRRALDAAENERDVKALRQKLGL